MLLFDWLCGWSLQVKPSDRGISLAQVGAVTAAMRDARSQTLPNGTKTPPKVSNSDALFMYVADSLSVVSLLRWCVAWCSVCIRTIA